MREQSEQNAGTRAENDEDLRAIDDPGKKHEVSGT